MKQPDDDGLTHFQRLNPEQFDVVLGAHPRTRKTERPPSSKSRSRIVIYLTILGIVAYILFT